MRMTGIPIVSAWNDPQRLGNGDRKGVNWRMNRDYLNYSIVEVGQNTEKSPGDFQSLRL